MLASDHLLSNLIHWIRLIFIFIYLYYYTIMKSKKRVKKSKSLENLFLAKNDLSLQKFLIKIRCIILLQISFLITNILLKQTKVFPQPLIDLNKMQVTQGQQFHYFIQLSASKIKQTQKFPEFEYMDYTIRKNYKQLKKTKIEKSLRPSEKFIEYFKNLQKQQQIKYYEKCLRLLEIAVTNQTSTQQQKKQRQALTKQGEAYVKKTYIHKWQKKSIKLENLHFSILDPKKPRSYPLKFYAIRKSKNKEHYGWVLQTLNDSQNHKLKTIHCGVRNVKDFQNWFQLIDKSIDFAKIDFYRAIVLGAPQEDDPKVEKKTSQNLKTMTEIFIDNQMKVQEDFEGNLDEIVEKQNQQKKQEKLNHKLNEQKPHPNVFKRLFPLVDLTSFTLNAMNSTLIQNGSGYRIVELPPYQGQQFRLKINIMIPFNKSLVFRALTEEVNLWNNQIDIFSVKTKISSQNSSLIYQKNKAQGLLYRERDYLYFRHCFSEKSSNYNDKNKIFIADKSIDSISYPPFMTVTRGEKKVIYCIIGNSEDKQSMLIIEGQIKGGGYMNTSNDKEMTVKFLKKFSGLQNFLKQKHFIQGNQKQKQTIFQQNWQVQAPQEDNFYDIENDQIVDSQDQSKEDEKQTKDVSKFDQEKNRKFSSNSDPDQNQFQQFIKKTTEEEVSTNMQKSQIMSSLSKEEELTFNKVYPYTPPQFAQDKNIIIPQKYLKVNHQQNPFPKSETPSLFPHYRGHHLFKGEWAVCPTGGLNYVDQQKMNQQKKVLTFIIRRIGKNILTGKGILNISLPVDIFCRQSNIQRFASSFAFFPMLMEKMSQIEDAKQQMKFLVGSVHFGSMIYMCMQKPFNPILGQTYQSWIDGCPVYFQQICHHPPIAAYLMVGRGYKLSGTLQAKMDISINSGTGTNEGIFCIQFDNGRKFHYTTAGGQISGLTYGERKLLLVGKSFYWCVQEGLFLELQYNPSSQNRRFFGGSKTQLTGDSQYHDFVEGTLKKYKKEDLEEFLTPKKGDFRKIMAIPKSSPTAQPICEFYKVTGRWSKYLAFDGQKMFDMDQNRYYTMKDEQNPLPSHSNYREDVVYRRLNNFVISQQFKEVLEVKQRKDRKLREAGQKNRK